MTAAIVPTKPKALLALRAALGLLLATLLACLLMTWSEVGEANVSARIRSEQRSGDILSRQFDDATRNSLHRINQELEIGAVRSAWATARCVGVLLALPLSWALAGRCLQVWMSLAAFWKRSTARRMERRRSQRHERMLKAAGQKARHDSESAVRRTRTVEAIARVDSACRYLDLHRSSSDAEVKQACAASIQEEVSRLFVLSAADGDGALFRKDDVQRPALSLLAALRNSDLREDPATVTLMHLVSH